MCRSSAAGNDDLTTRSAGRRPNKAPRHEIASGGSGPAVPQEGGAAKRLWRFGPEPAFRAIWAGCPPRVGIQLRRYGTNVAKRGDFTFCLIHDFNSLRVACTTAERVGLLTLADSTERFDSSSKSRFGETKLF